VSPNPNGGLPKKEITSVNKSQLSRKSLTLIRVIFLLTFVDLLYCLFWETTIGVRGARGIGPIGLTQPEKSGLTGGTCGRPEIRTYQTTFLRLCQPERSDHRMSPDPNGGLPKKEITSVNESQHSRKSLTLIRVIFLLTFVDQSYCLFRETALGPEGKGESDRSG
jgi:hypothetical protein